MASLPARLILSLQLLILLFGSGCANRIRDGEATETVELQKNRREFDFFKLSLLWPGTECRHTRRCCSANACCRSNSPTEFTIHGLWPDYNDGTWPACCKGSQYDEREISTLASAMTKYWPTYQCGSSSTCHHSKGSFWAHEWEKHGTCSYPVVRNEYEYFLTTLNVFFKYNVTEVLYKAGYVPSNSEKYPLGGIISAIQNAFHATPELTCSGGAVEELRLCFYKNFEPRDCATQSSLNSFKGSSCPKYVSLPAQTSALRLANNEEEASLSTM
ncbi:PREDICTED: ribonuclease 2-like [Ipomoea nil]|uniref:ribonuclease 2-like n=1 Tax=Ipomoea nil TaxID=35883 RepID=UPI000900A33D|nr:PREDICTED: ribonuclease 2-like [Ipomoea nil]